MRIRRFSPVQRLFHLFLLITFLIQSMTGLSRMYIETAWGRALSRCLGGYENARDIHIYVGLSMLCVFLIHAIYLIIKIDWKKIHHSLLGPDSLVPALIDIRRIFQHMAWFIGLKKKAPPFDRWGYWEKFDYWAVFWGMIIIGVTGLILAYSMAASRIMPGWVLNVAFWIHRIEAMLAMAHVFIIHFFIAHLRRHNFPMDRSIFEGSAGIKTVEHERPAWILRLKNEGRLNDVLVSEASLAAKIVYYVIGYIALATGIFLLVGALLNSSGVTW